MCHGADHRLHLWVFQGELWTYGEHPACRRRIGDSGALHFRLVRLSPNLSTPDAGATALRSGLVLVQLAQARMATSWVTPSLQQERDAEGSVPRWSCHAAFAPNRGWLLQQAPARKRKRAPRLRAKVRRQRSAAQLRTAIASSLSLWFVFRGGTQKQVVVAR